jgi:hypothetical protein
MAATSIPRRTILLDCEVLNSPGDFERILIHEIFHFVWVRLSNASRRDWERVLTREFASRATGELGWSAERRKTKLMPADKRRRTAAWRRYICESFCDTAAWRFAGLKAHAEFTLSGRFRRMRGAWFDHYVEAGVLL